MKLLIATFTVAAIAYGQTGASQTSYLPPAPAALSNVQTQLSSAQTTLASVQATVVGYQENSLATSSYNFAAQTPGISLTASVAATVTLIPCPLGVAGTHTVAANLPQNLYLSGGTGTAEAVSITGGTCAGDGATSGTITFTPANNHSGAWTISSATSGVEECIYVAGPYGSCVMPFSPSNGAPAVNLYGTLYIPDGYSTALHGQGVNLTNVVTNFTTGDGIQAQYVSLGGAINLGDFSIYGANYFGSGSSMIDVQARSQGVLDHIYAGKCYICFNIEGWSHAWADDLWAASFAAGGTGFLIQNSAGLTSNIGTLSHLRATTTNTGSVTGIELTGSNVGIILDSPIIEQGTTATSNDIGLFLNLGTTSSNIQVIGLLEDGYEVGVDITGSTACSNNSDIQIVGSHIGAVQGMSIMGAHACNVFVRASTITAEQGGAGGIPAASDRAILFGSGASYLHIEGSTLDSDGDSVIFTNGAAGMLEISNSRIGELIVNGGVLPTNGISLGNASGTQTGLRLIGNVCINQGIVANGTLTGNVQIGSNGCLGTTVTSIANSAALALPFTPSFTLTTGTGVTSVTTAESSGATWDFTVSSSTTFSAGASIGNTITITKIGHLFWDGTKAWISGV